MRDFQKIINSIENELEELKKINDDLILENTGLKNQLARVNGSSVSFVSVDDAFRSIFSSSGMQRAITQAYKAVKNRGYENICDLKGVPFCEWKGIGQDTATVIALVLEHYGIKPEMPVSGGYRIRYQNIKDAYYFK